MEILAEAIKKDPALPEKWKVEGERQYQQYLKRQQQSNLRTLGTTAGPIIIPIVFHIVDVASIVNSITDRDIYEQVEILNKDLLPLIAQKGSIAIDGISLTVVTVRKSIVEIALIPHTLENTTLGIKKEGDAVNIEVDILSRYISNIYQFSGNNKKNSKIY